MNIGNVIGKTVSYRKTFHDTRTSAMVVSVKELQSVSGEMKTTILVLANGDEVEAGKAFYSLSETA